MNKKTALLIIDMQKAIDDPQWGERNNPMAETQASSLLAFWRENGWPVFHIRHDSVHEKSPYRKNQPLHDFKPEVMPEKDELILGKRTNNAFIETALEEILKNSGILSVVICGVLTQHSVDCTARMAAGLGFNTTVISDATAASAVTDYNGQLWSAADVHAITLANLEADYAKFLSVADIIDE